MKLLFLDGLNLKNMSPVEGPEKGRGIELCEIECRAPSKTMLEQINTYHGHLQRAYLSRFADENLYN